MVELQFSPEKQRAKDCVFSDPVIQSHYSVVNICEYSLMVKRQFSKLRLGVRFSYSHNFSLSRDPCKILSLRSVFYGTN